ncbi:hypothetical protein NDA17_003654 [Ustilago hordei]|nr:hypothetical protein NDA17_003654 [Ustilago hordei]
MAMPTAESHESLSAAYASNYDYLDSSPQQHQQQQQQRYYQQEQQQPPQQPSGTQNSNSSYNAPGPSSSSASSSNAALSRGGGSAGSSGSQSYYSSATTANPPSHLQQPYPPQYAQHQQYQHQQYQHQQYQHQQYQHQHHSSPPTAAYRPSRQISSNYPEHAHSAALNSASSAAYTNNGPAPAISFNMYAQSNISMPALGPVAADSSSRAPPLADDLGDSFANMNIYGTPRLGPQRSKSPAPGYHPSADSASTKGLASAASVRTNAMYATQEIHQSAAEVQPENSLAAIADQVEQAAAHLDPNTTPSISASASSQNDHSAHHGGSSSAYHAGQNGGGGGGGGCGGGGGGERGGEGGGERGGAAAPDWVPHSQHGGRYGASVRQHSTPGEYPPGGQYAAGSMDGHGAGDGSHMPWDPNAAAAAYYTQNGAAQYPGFQPQAIHQASAGYPFSAQDGHAAYPSVGGPSAYESNPYFAAASGYLGFPDGAAPGFPPGADPYGAAAGAAGLMPIMPPGTPAGAGRPTLLSRQGTQLSMMSTNSNPLAGMASTNPRRKSKDPAPQQIVPFNKSFVAEYRLRMKGDPDPEAQFAYAKYLIEAAKKVQDPADGPKQQRKYRDTLLSESLKLIKRLATTGMGLGKPPYAEAQFFLANCFGNGSLGLQVDHEKAYNLYIQASKQNHPAATYRTAVCNEVGAGTRRDHHRAVLFYRKASALGDTAGMYKLGMVLLNGMLGQPRNVREAIVWLKRAATQADEDNPHALHELGLLHEKASNGVVLHDEAYARELFTQAAQLGYSPSQFKLGSAYEYGNLTCPVDPRRSIAWYTKAAQKGDGESELALSGWYLTGSEGVLKQSDSEAYLWARRAASKGIPKAEYAVGYYSEVGIGVNANLDEAKRWYMRAAAQGNKRAMQRLTELKKMKGLTGKKGARPTRKDAESECTIM